MEQAARLGIVLALLSAVGFSFKAILIKLAYPYGVDAVTLLTLRMLFSAPVYAVVLWRENVRRPAPVTRLQFWQIAGLGVVGYYGASLLDFLGLQYISAGLERVVLFAYPTLVVVLSALFLGKRIGRREGVALVLSYLGIAASFIHDIRFAGDASKVWLGGALVLGSALTYAIYLIGNGQLVARVGAARLTAQAMLWSAAAIFVQFLLSRPLSALLLPWPVYAYAIAMALFSTVLPTFMTSMAIRRIGSARFGLIGAVGPVATIFLGAWLLGERVTLLQLAGAALVMAGVVLVSRMPKPVPAPVRGATLGTEPAA